TATSGSTASPRSRKRGWQPQIRYAVTTSQTKRLSDPAQVDHGKPSARVACTTRSAVCASQPIRTPQVASRPGNPGRRAPPRSATAASPYASSAGQNRSSANRDGLPLRLRFPSPPCEFGQLGELPLEPRELRRDDHDVDEHHEEHDEVGRGD